MSKEEKNGTQSEKVLTKYDLKKQRREDEKAKEKTILLIWRLIVIVCIVGVAALIAYVPIKNHIDANKTVFTVGEHNVSQVEYDYYYNAVKESYLASYGQYLSYMGMSVDTDFSTVAYTDDLTFADYFQQQAAEQLQQNEGMKAQMAAEGFTYDSNQHYEEIMEGYKEAATESGVSLKKYLQTNYGSYATASRLKPIIMEAYEIGQFMIKKNTDLAPTDDEVEAYYNNNKDSYDSFDYYMTTVSANLPTEPTELADELPVYSEDGIYSPSDAEIEAAMAEAKANAEFIMDTIIDDENLHTGDTADSVNYMIKDWLIDSSRVKDDETIIEGSASHMYYLVKFVKRYRSNETTVNARIILTAEDNGAQIMAEYEEGGANLDSFLAVNDKYTTATVEGGLFEGLTSASFEGDVKDWLFNSARKEGEVANFYSAGYTYVIYYVGAGDVVWFANAKNALLNETMTQYLEDAKNSQPISDPDEFLVYLQQVVAVPVEEVTE